MTWEDEALPARERARALLVASDRGRTPLKRAAKWLEANGTVELRQHILEEGRARGANLPDEATRWPAKRLLRVARGRESLARQRQNPIAVDEGFTCLHCELPVPPHGRTARDHCPRCLWSVHVDVVPGDRAATCGGLLEPVGVSSRGSDTVLHYRCTRCGTEKVNRALTDGVPPDDWSAIVHLSSRHPR